MRVKILSMGDAGTGKSCIIKRFCEGEFVDEYISTIGIDFGVKNYDYKGNEGTKVADLVKINFWDTAGGSVYFDIRNEFYKDTNGAFLLFDVSDKSSFENLRNWIKEFREFASDKIYLVVVGNKTDKPRAVSETEGFEMAKDLHARFVQI